jgi:cysteine-S-conjugate beta-lyase
MLSSDDNSIKMKRRKIALPLLLAVASSTVSRGSEADSLDSVDLSLDQLRNRRLRKWQTHPADVLPASIADMDFATAPAINAALGRLQANQAYGYPARENAIADAFARRMQQRFAWSVAPGDVIPVINLDQAICAVILAFTDPSDGVIVQVPAYGGFSAALQATGRRFVANEMRNTEAQWLLDLEPNATSPGVRTRMLIFCNPHNPTGRVFTRHELEAVASFAIRHNLIVLSDEIHQDFVFPGGKHIPLASLGSEIADRTITITSATKSFSIAGLRCGVAHFGTSRLKRMFLNRIPANLLGTPSVTGIDATVAGWDDGQAWLDRVVAKLQRNRDWLLAELPKALPEAILYPPQGTYLAWINFSQLNLRPSPSQYFLDRARVALSAGSDFGEQYREFVRLNFATSAPILGEVVRRMSDAVMRR